MLTIPPQMTWRLQPLDTHGFHSFKTALGHVYQRRRALKADVDTAGFIQCVCEASKLAIETRAWSSAFEQNGFGCAQMRISANAKRDLHMNDACEVGKDPLTYEDLKWCFPKNASASARLAKSLFVECGGAPDRVEQRAAGSKRDRRDAGMTHKVRFAAKLCHMRF